MKWTTKYVEWRVISREIKKSCTELRLLTHAKTRKNQKISINTLVFHLFASKLHLFADALHLSADTTHRSVDTWHQFIMIS